MEAVRRETSRISRSSSNSFGQQSGKGGNAATYSGTPSNRPSLLSKAYNSVSHRGGKPNAKRNSALRHSRMASASGDDDWQFSKVQQTDLQSFSGVFPVPEEGCLPSKPAELTADQQKRYDEMLSYFKQQESFPISLKADDKGREAASEWEKLRYLSRESLLRYLRATRWDVKQAQKRLTDTIAWHREFGTENLDPDEMAIEAKSGKETVLGYDNRCRPLHYMHPHRSDTKESPRQMQFAVWILERCIDMMPPGVEQLVLLINFEGRSRNPTSIANAKLMLYILQNHYVERLGIALCINVPWVFKMFWNAIQAFIDPVTKSKCRFDEAVKSEVPLAQLSADFGGKLDSTYVHDSYWPELVRISKERRHEMMRRFKEDCKGEIGASEWIIRGGDDPSSPFNVQMGEKKDTSRTTKASASEDASTDASSVAPLVSDMRGSAPLELFKTPMDTLQPNPLERTFSVTNQSASDAHEGAKAAVVAGKTEGESAPEVSEPASEATNGKRNGDGDAPVRQLQHAFKDIEHKLQASKLFAAFHPDSQHRKSVESRRSGKESESGTNMPILEAIPSAHEIVAVAGTAGPQAAAGAVGAIVAEQARDGAQRLKSSAESQFATLTQTKGDDKLVGRAEISVRIVNVLFFAAAKDALGGRSTQQMAFPADIEAMSLREFREHMFEAFEAHKPSEGYDGKALRKVAEDSNWSVNEEMVEEEDLDKVKLHGGEDVAIIPPVSGG